MRMCRTITFVVALVAAIPYQAFGQTIAGTVNDASGAALPDVIVQAESSALIERIRTAVTDGSGQYRIESLRPGEYTVTFSLKGFSSQRRDGIEIAGTFTATVNAQLQVGALSEMITIVAPIAMIAKKLASVAV